MRDPAHNLIKVTSRTNRMQSELIIQKNCAESFLTQTREKTEEWEIWSLVSARSLFFLPLSFFFIFQVHEIWDTGKYICMEFLHVYSCKISPLPHQVCRDETWLLRIHFHHCGGDDPSISPLRATRSAAWNKWSSRRGQAEIARRLSGVYSTENTTRALFVFASLWRCCWSAARRRVHAG